MPSKIKKITPSSLESFYNRDNARPFDGEEKHIFPFQNNADAILNTALDYELSVLKIYAEPLLRCVKPTESEYVDACTLLSFLDNFATIDPTAVPPRSIIREFIGGSAFKY